jgi:hypothetical protein
MIIKIDMNSGKVYEHDKVFAWVTHLPDSITFIQRAENFDPSNPLGRNSYTYNWLGVERFEASPDEVDENQLFPGSWQDTLEHEEDYDAGV